MLPLFGRTRKAPADIQMESINDEWCIPNDQEIYGRPKITTHINEMVISDCELSESEAEATVDISVSGVTGVASLSFQSLNNGEADVVTVESEINFSSIVDDTFSIMNNETTVIESCDKIMVNDTTIESTVESFMPSSCDLKTILERLVALERKYEELNIKVTKMEQEHPKRKSSDSNPSIFVNDFINFMQDVMKSGLSYQQRVLNKFIDELETFEIDFSNFDPWK